MSARRSPSVRALFVTTLLALGAVAGGCGARAADANPDTALDAFGKAIRNERYDDAYALLSADYRRRVSYDEFRREIAENASEAQALAGLLAHPEGKPAIGATVRLPDGDTIELVHEDGDWRIVGNVVDFYDQSTPRTALRSFVRAMERRRYDVVMRFVPEADREGMSVERMREAWEGEGREEVERLIANLKASLQNPIEQVGDRATMAYGERFTVQFVREDGLWRIEDPD